MTEIARAADRIEKGDRIFPFAHSIDPVRVTSVRTNQRGNVTIRFRDQHDRPDSIKVSSDWSLIMLVD